MGGGGVHQKITEDHDHKEGGGELAKKLAKLKVFIKEKLLPGPVINGRFKRGYLYQ